MSHLSDNIKIIRKLAGETQPEFLKRFTGVTLAMQKSYEGGVAKPDILYIQELSELSGVSQDVLQKRTIAKKDVTIKAAEVEKDEKAHGKTSGSQTKAGADEEVLKVLKEYSGQPVIQVVLNLSYIGKRNADSIDKLADSMVQMTKGVDKMAATNQRNTDIIAALVASVIPNSKFAEKLAASLGDQHEDDDFSIEDELNEAGIDLLKRQLQAGKKATENR